MKRSRYRYGRQTGIVLDQRAVDCRTVIHAVETLHRPLQHLLRVSSVENQPPHPHDSHQLRHHVAVHSPTDATRLHRTPSWSVRPSLLVILITTITNRHFKHSGRSLLWAYYNCDTSTIRVRFDYDSSAIQHPTRSYVLSSNNEHVNSFPLL